VAYTNNMYIQNIGWKTSQKWIAWDIYKMTGRLEIDSKWVNMA
jgi:hypothetical protein